jgi:hypothetical protein
MKWAYIVFMKTQAETIPVQDEDRFLHQLWNTDRWPNFSAAELSCRHCGESYHWPEFVDRLQCLRDEIKKPLYILSGHRCALHNARVGGAPLSQHLKLAADISLRDINRFQLRDAAKRIGFSGFGYYSTFLHLDLGRPRHWVGSEKARQLWQMH